MRRTSVRAVGADSLLALMALTEPLRDQLLVVLVLQMDVEDFTSSFMAMKILYYCWSTI